MKLRRLAAMGPAEIVVRGRQEAAKHLERVAAAAVSARRRSPRFIRQLARDPALEGIRLRARRRDWDGAARGLFDRFRAACADRFFAGAGDERVPALIAGHAPRFRDQTIATAGMVAQGRFHILGYCALFFGDPVDWHLDPLSARQAPRVHWSQIDPLDPGMVGDSKVTWELNRHQWLLDLGQAYRFTRAECHGQVFSGLIREWMRANPPGIGINWASSLELSFRIISWCWALHLFQGSEALTPRLFAGMLGWIGAQAAHVERYLSYYFSPNTHLTGEALGLFYVGTLFPELDGAERWRALGARILAEQIERQVHPDGVYFEQSTCYQRYTVEIYLHFLILAARHGISVPATVGERVQRMLDFLLTVRRPDGSIPQIGDADGGWLLPLVRRAPDDFRGIFAVAAVVFKRPDYAWAAGEATPEVFWLLGGEGGETFDALQPAPPAIAPSRLFADGGYAVMRSGWDRQAHQMTFDIGPLGCPVSGGHGHADLLGIQCALFGEPYLIDPGTYGYTAEPRWRDHFRGTAAHSTVTIDGLNQAVPNGPFGWRQRPRARLRRWVSTEAFDLADAEHDAYRFLPDPVVHRRRVFFAKPRYWVVVDELDGKAEHRVDLYWQFAPMEITLGAGGWALARRSKAHDCRILVCATAPLSAELAEGDFDSMRGWHSPDYGRREPTPMLTYSTVTRLPLRIVTLLFPVTTLSDVPPVVAASLEHRRIDLVFEDRLESLHIGEQDIVLERVCLPGESLAN